MSNVERKDWKNYIWTIPALGVILALIGLLTPTAYFSISGYGSQYWWIWGLVYMSQSGYGSDAEFFIEMYEMFIPSMICFVLLFICFFVFISQTIAIKKRPSKSGTGLIIVGILFIAIMIAYYVAMDVGFVQVAIRELGYDPGITFWDGMDPHFGFIGPILAGILAIIGGAIASGSDRIDTSLQK